MTNHSNTSQATNTVDTSELNIRELNLRDRELDIRELELKHKRFLETLKIITTGIVVTLIPAIINHQIQNQEIEIKRLEGEIEYLDKFSNDVVEQDDLIKRRNFVEYLATVAHSEKSRARWETYLEKINKLAENQQKVESEIASKEAKRKEIQIKELALKKKVAEAKEKDEKSENLRDLQEALDRTVNQVTELELDIFKKERERQVLIQNSKLIDNRSSTSESPKTAKEWEHQGFMHLLDRDVDNAINAFSNSEKKWPDYHNVAEIKHLLTQNREFLKTPEEAKWKDIYQEILEQFSWGMPSKVRQQIQTYITQ